jgi:toxin CptA
MPLACLRQLLAAYLLAQRWRWVNLPSFDTRVGQPAWAVVPAACRLGIATPDSADPRAGLRGLRRDADGWQLWSRAAGWQAVQFAGQPGVADGAAALRCRASGG